MVEKWDVKEQLTPLIGDIKTNIPLLNYAIIDLTTENFNKLSEMISSGQSEVRINIPDKNILVTLRRVED